MVGHRRGRWPYLYFDRVPKVLGGEWTVQGASWPWGNKKEAGAVIKGGTGGGREVDASGRMWRSS